MWGWRERAPFEGAAEGAAYVGGDGGGCKAKLPLKGRRAAVVKMRRLLSALWVRAEGMADVISFLVRARRRAKSAHNLAAPCRQPPSGCLRGTPHNSLRCCSCVPDSRRVRSRSGVSCGTPATPSLPATGAAITWAVRSPGSFRMRRGAQQPADQGSRLFERNAVERVRARSRWMSTAGCPQ